MSSEETQSQNVALALKYLGLPADHEPSPERAPIDFLSKHLQHLPPNILELFSPIVTPKQRTVIPAIRNRRLRYAESGPPALSLSIAKATWPTLWPGKVTPELAREPGNQEKQWVENEFLVGQEKKVGKLGELLRGYEEEREAERARALRRQQRELEEELPEEDEDTDDEEYANLVANEEMSTEEANALFMRRIKEKLIYGLLDVRAPDSQFFHCL